MRVRRFAQGAAEREGSMNPGESISLQTVNGWAMLPSSLKRADQSPRFHLHFLAGLAGDVGAQHLIINEANAGYEPPTRDLLERVLRAGDLFVDVGAHWGFFSLLAATHPAGGIDVVAFEPDLTNALTLTENVARNGLANAITVVCAACGNRNEMAPLVLNTTMGHSIRGIGLAPAARGVAKWVPVVTLDGALAGMGKQAGRLILKIDAEGFEPNVIVGAQALLAAGRIALIIWERGPAFSEGLGRAAMTQMTALLSECGFRHILPPAVGEAGAPLQAFDPQVDYIGNVFSIGPLLRDDPLLAAAAA